MRGWAVTCLVPLLVALRASAHGYVSKIIVDGVAYAGNEPNDDTGEWFASFGWLTSPWRSGGSGEGVVAAVDVVAARLPRRNASVAPKALKAFALATIPFLSLVASAIHWPRTQLPRMRLDGADLAHDAGGGPQNSSLNSSSSTHSRHRQT